MDAMPTLLDRLSPPALSAEGGLLHDLERLLNARCLTEFPAGFGDLADSLPGYGLPDLSPERLAEGPAQDLLCEAIRRKVLAFEPRLRGVRVAVAERGPLRLRLRIEAELAPPPHRFRADALFRLDGRGGIQIEERLL